MYDHKELRKSIISAAYKSVLELIKVLSDEIITDDNMSDISADKMRNAVLAKKAALDDAFYILSRIESEEDNLNDEKKENANEVKFESFAEKRSKGRG